jgi:hypothetical protein
MNIENFSMACLPSLADLGDTKNWASIKGDDPGPIGSVGYSATGVGRGNLTSTTSTGICTNGITVGSSNPCAYGPIKTERLPMSEELYLYITGGKSCISTAPPIWNSQENCLWHAKGSRVLSIEGDYGLSRLIKSYIGSELDVIYTYLTINGFDVYATILGPSGELFVEKAPIKGKEDLIHRSRKK